jgi:hypothetical protein
MAPAAGTRNWEPFGRGKYRAPKKSDLHSSVKKTNRADDERFLDSKAIRGLSYAAIGANCWCFLGDRRRRLRSLSDRGSSSTLDQTTPWPDRTFLAKTSSIPGCLGSRDGKQTKGIQFPHTLVLRGMRIKHRRHYQGD